MEACGNDHAAILIDVDLGHDRETAFGNLERQDHDRIFRSVDGNRQDKRVSHFYIPYWGNDTLLGERNQSVRRGPERAGPTEPTA